RAARSCAAVQGALVRGRAGPRAHCYRRQWNREDDAAPDAGWIDASVRRRNPLEWRDDRSLRSCFARVDDVRRSRAGAERRAHDRARRRRRRDADGIDRRSSRSGRSCRRCDARAVGPAFGASAFDCTRMTATPKVLHAPIRADTADAVLPGLRWALARDIKLALRSRTELAVQLLFYVIVVTLFPLATTPERTLLATMGPGVLWVTALLASLLSLPRLFAADYADGTLE